MRWFALGMMGVVIACGPAVQADGDGTTSSSSGDEGETSTPTPTTAPADESTTGADTSTTGEPSSDSDADDAGVSIVDPSCGDDPDLRFTHCGDIQCDVWAQDCMEGQKCMPREDREPMVWTRYVCVDLAPEPGAPGEPCFVDGDQWTGLDDCQIGAMCWDIELETNAGTCVEFCGGSQANPACDEGLICFTAYEDHINLCLPPCDPLGSTCAEGHACVQSHVYLDPRPFACVPEILVADHTAYADACDDIVGCGSGLLCVDAEDVPGCDTDKCCSLLCDPLADNGCPELARGQLCVPYGEQPSLGHCGF